MKKTIAAILSLLLIFGCAVTSASANDSLSVSSSDEFVSAVLNADNGSTIYLQGGTYRFDSPIVLDSISSKSVTVSSAPGETAVLTNACLVTGWTECTVNGIRAFSASAGGRRISALFAGETKLPVSRLPETGYFHVDKKDHSDTKGSGQDIGSCGFFADDLEKEPINVKDVTVEILHQWVSEVAQMISYDKATGSIKFDGYTGRPIEDGDRYFLENVFEGLDKPGEWCFDSEADKVYYVPYDGESVDEVRLYASSTYSLMEIKNSSDITFERIKFANTGWDYQNEKYLNMNIHTRTRDWHTLSLQGGVDVPGAIEVTYSENISFVNCEFENIGSSAIRFYTGTKKCSVDSCLFSGIGGSAVYIGGRFMFAEENDLEKDLASDITVTNSEIENYGLQFFGACGIIVTYCDKAEISNNEIHDGYYTGISAGFMWLFFDNPTENIKIKDNLIYNIGLETLSDLGGIYLLGVQEGTVVSGNVIHDCTCYSGEDGYAGDGIYLDSGCEFMTIENNLVFNCTTSCFNTTLSKNNIIKNNIFAYPGQSAAALGVENYNDVYTDLNNVYINNILLTDNKVPVIEYLQKEGHFAGSGNILWDMTYGDELYFTLGRYVDDSRSRETVEKNNYVSSAVYKDPGFKNAPSFDFSLDNNSNAVKLGFEPFDYSKAGTLKGTIVGLDKSGGQTEYNADTKEHSIRPAKVSFIEKLKMAFSDFIDSIRGIFTKLFRIGDTGITDTYTTDFTPGEKNEKYVEELSALFDKVKEHTPKYTVDASRKPFADDDRIQAIYFDGEECNGKSSEIFAYIGFPEGASAANPVPAMVLVHGGGVHAQADWVQYWVDRGYAAIAMDGMAQEPIVGYYSAEGNNNPDWPVNPDSHLPFSGLEDVANDFTQQWFYYFITDIILSNNILRADSRIIKDQIGVSGISWGGLAVTVAACYDDRFEFAIPIYGCGCWKLFKGLFSNELVFEKWDPTPLLGEVEMPMLFVSGDEDPFFNAYTVSSSAAIAKHGSTILINGLNHGAFQIEETVRFANEQTGNGNNNIRIIGMTEEDGKINVTFDIPEDTTNPKVIAYYRSSPLEYEGLAIKEKWSSKTATVSGDRATVTIPADTTMYYIAVEASCGVFTDRSITASTGVFVR